MRATTILADLESIRGLMLSMPYVRAESLAAILFTVQELTDLAYDLEQISARPSLLNHWIVYRWN